jgi:hypothetical protein
MYSMSHPVSALSNGGLGNGMMDGSGTINPAALNSSGMLHISPSPISEKILRAFSDGGPPPPHHRKYLLPVTSAASSR